MYDVWLSFFCIRGSPQRKCPIQEDRELAGLAAEGGSRGKRDVGCRTSTSLSFYTHCVDGRVWF